MIQQKPGVSPPSERDPVEELAEVFLERFRRGERPAIIEFIARAPEHADEIRELFPALILMEQANPAGTQPSACVSPAVPLERLGDYRIIREVGRGGMGIVYEAEQEALNRHVALKVLPPAGKIDPQRVLRFRREARSAARLHHTNIVPVFDIGERDGVHFYAMQFIQGQGLDQVITELPRLRGHAADELAVHPPGKMSEAPRADVANLAEGLLSGQFGREALPSREPSPSDGPEKENAAVSATISSSRTDRKDTGASSSLVHHSNPSSSTGSLFYRSVAQIGRQVASALAYAHSQRVLHRDIKPSNLLLDSCGTVWVTDFGLAKEKGDNLTRSGDVVGTLRYMAPERFSGVWDSRSDIYSLGLTLYELVTLQPAFREADRVRLVHAITNREPDAPGKLDPHVPRDLETIILKAINKEPSGRYASALDLEEDLNRFLLDRPIGARRAQVGERVRRWCRRNPGWSATIATVLGLLIVIAVGGSVLSLHLGRALHDLQAADREKTDRLWQAHLERARALRSSDRIGKRFEALGAIREAARIKVTPELRDEAAAALVLPDIEIAREWEGHPDGTLYWAQDRALSRYARINKKGELTVCHLSPAGEEIIARLPGYGEPPFWGLWMSPDGRFLAYGHSSPQEGIAGALRVWKLDGATPTVHLDEPAGMHLYALSFHDDGKRLAIGHTNGTISIYDLETRKRRRLRIGQLPHTLAFHPRDGRLAAACGTAVRLFDVDAEKELAVLRDAKIKTWSFGLAWHPDGQTLAATSDDKMIHLWDTKAAVEMMRPLEGHTASGIFMAFNHTGDRLISTGWDGQTRVWDTSTGRFLLSANGSPGMRFSTSGSFIGMARSGTRLRIWRLADGSEFRSLRRLKTADSQPIFNAVLHENDRVVAAGAANGLSFFDLESGRELAWVPTRKDTSTYVRSFDPAEGWMAAWNGFLWLWPARREPTRTKVIQIGPPRAVASTPFAGAGASIDGRVRAVARGNGGATVINRDRPGRVVQLQPQYDVRHCAVSPDGRWVASCSWWLDHRSPSVRIWNAETGHHVSDLPIEGHSSAQFSPDGRWLATHTTEQGCQIWETGSWRARGRFETTSYCWCAHGSLLAVSDALGVIQLIEPDSGREVLRLSGPDGKWYHPACFTSDGARLVAFVPDERTLYVWELRSIREQLQELGMDWDLPPFAPASDTRVAGPPVAVEVVPGVVRPPILEDDHHAIAALCVFIALQPINPEAYLLRGLAREGVDEHALAVADYEMFLALTPKHDPRRPEIQFRRASLYHDKLNNKHKAIAALADATNAAPESIPWPERCARLCNQLAWQIVARSPVTEAPEAILQLARRAVELEPHNHLFQNTLGVALYRLGRYEEAARCLEANFPESREYAAFDLYFLAMCQQQLGEPEKAREYFDRANALRNAEPGLSAQNREELASFRREAEAVLAIRGHK